ncbi:hypothetical protein RRG08_009090 [Elysia crispata]|uniref:Uncharacterized protein n=1 Tax=Elysia crispata TaxID=231223 RepID=A0AAE0Y8Q8_9GAST|nr:hypothetical protein RRG08_009090 [Elysia crispata]
MPPFCSDEFLYPFSETGSLTAKHVRNSEGKVSSQQSPIMGSKQTAGSPPVKAHMLMHPSMRTGLRAEGGSPHD